MRKLLLVCSIGLILLGCSREPAPLTAGDIEAINNLDNTLNKAMLTKDVDLFLSCYAEDMIQVNAFDKTEGKEKFAEGVKIGFEKYISKYEIEEATVEKVEGAGNYAYMWTHSKGSTHFHEGNPWIGVTRTLKVVRKNPQGKWEIIADMFVGIPGE